MGKPVDGETKERRSSREKTKETKEALGEPDKVTVLDSEGQEIASVDGERAAKMAKLLQLPEKALSEVLLGLESSKGAMDEQCAKIGKAKLDLMKSSELLTTAALGIKTVGKRTLETIVEVGLGSRQIDTQERDGRYFVRKSETEPFQGHFVKTFHPDSKAEVLVPVYSVYEVGDPRKGIALAGAESVAASQPLGPGTGVESRECREKSQERKPKPHHFPEPSPTPPSFSKAEHGGGAWEASGSGAAGMGSAGSGAGSLASEGPSEEYLRYIRDKAQRGVRPRRVKSLLEDLREGLVRNLGRQFPRLREAVFSGHVDPLLDKFSLLENERYKRKFAKKCVFCGHPSHNVWNCSVFAEVLCDEFEANIKND